MNQSLTFFRSSPRLLTSAIIIGAPILCLSLMHYNLSRLINHTTEKGTLTAKATSNIDSIPEHNPIKEQCFMVHDTASKAVRKDLLPSLDTDTLLTSYLRNTMCRFSNFPQAWILRLVSDRATFQRGYLEELDFRVGDVVCGLYRVVLRTDRKAEFLMKQGAVEGRLVVGMRVEEEEVVFYSETVMWKGADDRTVMPLERAVPKWLHELASWSLLDSGTKHLVGLRNGS